MIGAYRYFRVCSPAPFQVCPLRDGSTAPTGEIRWRVDLDDFSCPVATPAQAADGTLYFSAEKLHAVSTAGVPVWSFTPRFPEYGATPVVVSDGTILWRDAFTL